MKNIIILYDYWDNKADAIIVTDKTATEVEAIICKMKEENEDYDSDLLEETLTENGCEVYWNPETVTW